MTRCTDRRFMHPVGFRSLAADAESEGRKRKAEIDQQAKADKAAVDKETAKKRRSLVRQGSKAQDELDLRLRRRKEAAQRRIFGAPREDL